MYGNQMYASENIIQEFFKDFNYIDNPFLADLFLISHDLYCFLFSHQLGSNFTNQQFKQRISYYSQYYFEPIIHRVRFTLPYWTMRKQHGSNHIVAFVGGRNMGVLDIELQNILTHVIQLGLT